MKSRTTKDFTISTATRASQSSQRARIESCTGHSVEFFLSYINSAISCSRTNVGRQLAVTSTTQCSMNHQSIEISTRAMRGLMDVGDLMDALLRGQWSLLLSEPMSGSMSPALTVDLWRCSEGCRIPIVGWSVPLHMTGATWAFPITYST